MQAQLTVENVQCKVRIVEMVQESNRVKLKNARKWQMESNDGLECKGYTKLTAVRIHDG